jgi:hypothetical protein
MTHHRTKPTRFALKLDLNQKKAAYLISVALISVLFVASLIGVLTGKFRPFAAENGGGSGRRVITLPAAELTWNDSTGNSQKGTSNQLKVTLAPFPAGAFTIQGLPNLSTISAFEMPGKLTIKRKQDNKTIVDKADWVSKQNANATTRKVTFDNEDILDGVDALSSGYVVTMTLKPKYYLATTLQNITNVDTTVTFPQVKAGDMNDDNVIDEADFAISGPQFNQAVNNSNRHIDVNRDGKIDEADFAITGPNFGATGASF